MRSERADAHAQDVAHAIAELRAEGTRSMRALADGLTARGVPAARGGRWSAGQVSRVLARVGTAAE